MRGLNYEIVAVNSLLPVVATTSPTSTGVDLAGYEGAALVAHVGASGDTLGSTVYLTVKFQESDNNSDWTDIAAGNLLGGANGVVIDAYSEDEVVIERGYIGSKRYVRVAFVFTGTHTNGTPVAGLVLKGLPRHAG